MKLVDLTNNTVTTLQNCESEPIHLPGAIQPHGVLLGINKEGIIVFCSANTLEQLGLQPEALLSQPINSLSEELVPRSKENSIASFQNPLLLMVSGKRWDVFFHPADEGCIVEMEAHHGNPYDPESIFDQTAQFTMHIERSRSLQDLSQRIASQVKLITGYDRVMIYCFDEEYNGRVFAESKEDHLEPFLNLHYPHTDIPAQARDLYLRNLVRLISDVNYVPVPLLTMEAHPATQPDLSDVDLRSVSPIHIQYLKNMGVGATLTVSLVLEGKLWGLIACHHYSPKHLSFFQRKAALLQAHFLTSQINVRQVAEEYEVYTVVEAHLQQLLHQLQQQGDFELSFGVMSSLMAVTNSSGVAVMHRGQLYEKGLVPARDKTKLLFQWMAENVTGWQFSTSNLMKYYGEAEKISASASGILYHKLGDPKKDAIIWFREEMERTINWAGDPGDAVKKIEVNNDLRPRTSFAIFKQSIRNQSREWRTAEINAATRFAMALQNNFHLEYLKQEELRQRLLNEQLQKANKELANINWITSHDLKEPLRKILIFSSKVMTEEEQSLSESVVNALTRIQHSARRMQSLVSDIISYSLADDKTQAFEDTDLNLIAAEVLQDFADDLNNIGGTCLIEELPVVKVIPYQIKQLFVNIIGNSVKFARKETPLQIEISCKKSRGLLPGNSAAIRSYYLIQFRDNGIGFDPAKSEQIFDIFYRLHLAEDYAGTGIGLAICRRIAENHGGAMTASGEKGFGASFQLYLPE